MIPTHLALARRRRTGAVLAHVVVDGELQSRTRGSLYRHPGEALCAKPHKLSGAPLDDGTVTLALTGHLGASDAGRAAILEAEPCSACMTRYRRLLAADEIEPHCRRTHAGPLPEVSVVALRKSLAGDEDVACPRCGDDDFGTFIGSDGEERANCMDCGLTVGREPTGKPTVLS